MMRSALPFHERACLDARARLVLIALGAIQNMSDKLFAAFRCQHPFPDEPGRIVPHMIPVPAA